MLSLTCTLSICGGSVMPASMELSNVPTNPKRVNVLTLDGGGVRGLSSLLVLQDLMVRINSHVNNRRPNHKEVQPSDIFDLVAGTSTGGLIAIMLGKLGMTITECIETYTDLARTIFGSSLRTCIGDLVARQRRNKDLPMASDGNGDAIAWEYENESQYSELKDDAVCLCSSKPCPEQLECLVCDAARATSAAPTFFPPQLIDKRLFVDGGIECNNPSAVILDHYSQFGLCHGSGVDSEANSGSAHGNLDFSCVRFINLGTGTGTGTEPGASQPYRRGFLAKFEPAFLRMGRSLNKILQKSATNTKMVTNHMTYTANMSSEQGSNGFKYARFSADNGVHRIGMDQFQHMHTIQKLTTEYLQSSRTQSSLKRLAEEIADEYIMNEERSSTVLEASPLNSSVSNSIGTPSSPGYDSYLTNSSATSTSALDSGDATC